MTTADSILADLQDGEWHCGSGWYATFRPTFSQRISIDLKAKRRLQIESRVCHRHEHKGGIHEYRLIRQPEQLVLGAA